MEQEKSVVSQISFGILCMIMSFSLLLVGCSKGAAPENIVTTPESQVPDEPAPVPVVDDVAVAREDPTTAEVVKQEQTLKQLIADGTHETTITYQAPPQVEEADVSITTEKDVVTALSITPGPNAHAVSKGKMAGSEAGLRELMIGKNIADIEIPTQVGGSSLTTGAFKEYFEGLKSA